MSSDTDSNKRHAKWMEADNGLFKSVQETKLELAKAVMNLDFNAGVCSESRSAIKASLHELDVFPSEFVVAKQTLNDFDEMVSDLSAKIAELHLQVSNIRMFIARETIAHHDAIAQNLTNDELLQIQELNAFLPDSIDIYNK